MVFQRKMNSKVMTESNPDEGDFWFYVRMWPKAVMKETNQPSAFYSGIGPEAEQMHSLVKVR